MTRYSRAAVAILAAVVCFVFLVVFLTLPPRPARLDPSGWGDFQRRTIAGAYHVHTTRSDGAGDKTAVAAAAARAGLQFVVLTDHGDGTRPSDPPAYIDGVLCLDAVEISTDDGHYVALGMAQAPYPLGGSGAAVAEDVARLGGFGIAAHPDSPKPELRWSAPTVAVDGLEWLNADSEWRRLPRTTLARAAVGYLFRPPAALASLLHRPEETFRRWDAMTRTRRVVGLAALDAHGGVRRQDEGASIAGGIPSYEASFRTFSDRIVLEHPLSGDAAADARDVYAAIRAGRLFSTIDAVAGPGLIDFHADTAAGRVPMGGVVPQGSAATLVARALAPDGADVVLMHDGREVRHAPTGVRARVTSGEGAFRVEVRAPAAPGEPPVPWLVSNPIYFLAPHPSTSSTPPEAGGRAVPIETWHLEKDDSSSGILRTFQGTVELEYTLGKGEPRSQFVAAVAALSPGSPIGAIDFHAASNQPMRVSVQLRFDRTGGAPRWGSSVYVSRQGVAARVEASALRAMQRGRPPLPDARSATGLLFVIDLTNTPPGRHGILRLSNVSLGG
ncbi:MAG TPA: hypothetical protein VFX12_13455 [Vicinamibacterales bacterium]|nr:hypothetical protein [Vicinamibacterales bacterium]